MDGLQVSNVDKSFGEKQALSGVSIQVEAGEILAVLGPSGCGKSTLLMVVAGLEPPDNGDVLWNGSNLAGAPPHQRSFGLMFQDYALFPHLNVFQNVAFGLQMAGMPNEQIQSKVAEALELVNLPGFDRRDVNTLSGGEQQRVALARALAPRPRLLMLDEPLGALDRTLRERLLFELQEILRRLKQTTIYVTHDQEEAFSFANRVAVMDAGRIVQSGAPREIYRRPASPLVARFLGLSNLIEGTATRTGNVETALGVLPAPGASPGPGILLLRPDAARMVDEAAPIETGSFRLSGNMRDCSFRGSTVKLEVEVSGKLLRFELPADQMQASVGEQMTLEFDPQKALQWFAQSTAQASP